MNVRNQQGMSLIGFLLVLAMVVFFAYIALRITPIYLEYFSVVRSMQGIAEERGSARYTPFDIKDKLLNRLYLSYSASNVTAEHIRIIRRDGVQLRVAYEVRKPMLGNLDIIATFDHAVMLSN